MLPALEGAPVRVVMRTSLGPHLAAVSVPHRIIYLTRELLHKRGDFERILVHEIFHLAWVRLSNETRRDWERILAAEMRAHIKGELGWSAEKRKEKLKMSDVRGRTQAWRHYACESFCDTAARVFSGVTRHCEFTLPSSAVRQRAAWMKQVFATKGVRL